MGARRLRIHRGGAGLTKGGTSGQVSVAPYQSIILRAASVPHHLRKVRDEHFREAAPDDRAVFVLANLDVWVRRVGVEQVDELLVVDLDVARLDDERRRPS